MDEPRCVNKMKALILGIDQEIKSAPRGPISRVREHVGLFIPLKDCEASDFKDSVKRSIYFQQIDEMPNYDIAIIANGNVEVGISYYRQEKMVDEVYVMIRK